MEQEGVHIPGYTFLRTISKGGQAIIFLAEQQSTGRNVAVKVLLESLGVDLEAERKRMEREARIMAMLDHPNIVSVIDYGQTEAGLPFFILEYVQGKTLLEYMEDIRSENPVSGLPRNLAPLLRLFYRICEAVNTAHLRGVVHRDLKPENIIVDAYGEPHILDFGVARAPVTWLARNEEFTHTTTKGEFVGSLFWASPEQVSGSPDAIDTRSDVYSLGVILYEILAGESPYETCDTLQKMLNSITHAKPKPPSHAIRKRIRNASSSLGRTLRFSMNPVNYVLDSIVLSALAKDPRERYQTAGEFGADVLYYLEGKTTRAEQRNRIRRWTVKLALPVSLAAFLLLALLVYWQVITSSSYRTPTRPVHIEEPTDYEPPGEHYYGYAIDQDDIVFIFDVAEADYVRNERGDLVHIDEISRVEFVSIAGAFNHWNMNAHGWFMSQTPGGRHVLRKSKDLFRNSSEWPFKFVINGTVWVGAPERAANKMIVPEDNETHNYLLFNPREASSEKAMQMATYREGINAVWPGQASSLALDDHHPGLFYFTFSQLTGTNRVDNLEPLRDIPLRTLHMAHVHADDTTAITNQRRLARLFISDQTYSEVVRPLVAMARSLIPEKRESLVEQNVFPGYDVVPAVHPFRDFIVNGLRGFAALRTHQQTIPQEARYYRGRSYLPIIVPATWNDAQRFAERCGAHLLTITNEELNDWIVRTYSLPALGRSFWLGARDHHATDNWQWHEEGPVRFHRWRAARDLDHDAANRTAAAMDSEGWWIMLDADTTTLPFILEWRH